MNRVLLFVLNISFLFLRFFFWFCKTDFKKKQISVHFEFVFNLNENKCCLRNGNLFESAIQSIFNYLSVKQ